MWELKRNKSIMEINKRKKSTRDKKVNKVSRNIE